MNKHGGKDDLLKMQTDQPGGVFLTGASPITAAKPLYRWRSVKGPEFPRYPLSEQVAADIAAHMGCEIEKAEDYVIQPMKSPGF